LTSSTLILFILSAITILTTSLNLIGDDEGNRQIRYEISAEFNHDTKKMYAYYKPVEEELT